MPQYQDTCGPDFWSYIPALRADTNEGCACYSFLNRQGDYSTGMTTWRFLPNQGCMAPDRAQVYARSFRFDTSSS